MRYTNLCLRYFNLLIVSAIQAALTNLFVSEVTEKTATAVALQLSEEIGNVVGIIGSTLQCAVGVGIMPVHFEPNWIKTHITRPKHVFATMYLCPSGICRVTAPCNVLRFYYR